MQSSNNYNSPNGDEWAEERNHGFFGGVKKFVSTLVVYLAIVLSAQFCI